MTEHGRRRDEGLARCWAARTSKVLSDWRWAPVLGKVGLGLFALALLSVLGAGGLQSAGASPEELTVASIAPSVESIRPPETVPRPPDEAPPADPSPTDVDCDADVPRGVTDDGRVVLNAATEVELRTLPGVGPARAAAIIALRERLGRYRRVEELLRVRGIGPRSLQKLRPLVVVDAPAPDE